MEPTKSAVSPSSVEDGLRALRECRSGVVRVGFYTQPGPKSVGHVQTTIKATAPVSDDDLDLLGLMLRAHVDAVNTDSKRSGQPAFMCQMVDHKEDGKAKVEFMLAYAVWSHPHECGRHPEWLDAVVERITKGRTDVSLILNHDGSRLPPEVGRIAAIHNHISASLDGHPADEAVCLLSVEDECGSW